MFIIPFIHNQKTIKDIQVSVVQILAIGGTMLWEEDNKLDVVRDLLEPNGLFLESPVQKHKKFMFCPIDRTKTAMNDFYRWEETEMNSNHDVFCWRTFYLFSEMQSAKSEMPSAKSEMPSAKSEMPSAKSEMPSAKSKSATLQHMLPCPSSVKLHSMPVMDLLQPILCGSKHH